MVAQPPAQQQPQREQFYPITEWGGMVSNLPLKSIPLASWSYLLNMDFDGPNRLRTRKGTVEFMGNGTTGSTVQVVAAYEFKKSTDTTSKVVLATNDGKLYWVDPTSTTIVTLIGSMTAAAPTSVWFAMMSDTLYIADGTDAFKWDGTTLTKITSTFPAAVPSIGNITAVVATRDRLWWATSNDWIVYSVPNTPDDLTTTVNGAGKMQVQYNEGMDIASMIVWGGTILINKEDAVTGNAGLYWLTGSGTTDDPFSVNALFSDAKSPTAFVGKSGIQVGSDVIGLTRIGLTSVSAIQNFQEAQTDLLSIPIDDIIRRINWDVSYKICATYDAVTKQYMCAVPLDSASSNNAVLVYDRQGDRWSLYNNWTVRSWLRIKTDVLYGSEDGRIIKTRFGDNDLGSGFQKVAEGGDFHFGQPHLYKHFKLMEIDVTHDGDYDIDFTPIIDGFDNSAITISLTLDTRSSLWDVFEWDTDFFDVEGNTVRTIYILGMGKYLRPKFYNDQPDEPFSIGALTYGLEGKNTGTIKI